MKTGVRVENRGQSALSKSTLTGSDAYVGALAGPAS